MTPIAELEVKVDDLEVSPKKAFGKANQLKWMNGEGWNLHVKECWDAYVVQPYAALDHHSLSLCGDSADVSVKMADRLRSSKTDLHVQKAGQIFRSMKTVRGP